MLFAARPDTRSGPHGLLGKLRFRGNWATAATKKAGEAVHQALRRPVFVVSCLVRAIEAHSVQCAANCARFGTLLQSGDALMIETTPINGIEPNG